jgi:APA family basic amino acid/polyamine antiporter
LGLLPLLAILTIVVIGYLIYLKIGKKTARTGILRKYGHRPALYLLYKKNKKVSRETLDMSKCPIRLFSMP